MRYAVVDANGVTLAQGLDEQAARVAAGVWNRGVEGLDDDEDIPRVNVVKEETVRT